MTAWLHGSEIWDGTFRMKSNCIGVVIIFLLPEIRVKLLLGDNF